MFFVFFFFLVTGIAVEGETAVRKKKAVQACIYWPIWLVETCKLQFKQCLEQKIH